ncbi:hypothetical protein ACHAXR_013348 [Thalassiosira sp. AJA248-18]
MLLSRLSLSTTVPMASALVFSRRASLHCYQSCGASFSSAADTTKQDDVNVLQTTGSREIGDEAQSSQSQPQTNNGAPMQQPQQTRRRTRRRTTQSSLDGDGAIPSLADFMHRAKVLKQYRNFVRLAQFVDDKDSNGSTASGECRVALEEVRLSYKMGKKKDVDGLSKNMAYSDGERRLRELEAMVGYSANKRTQESNAISPESFDEDSWINIKDEEDPRGRVGVQWPWEKE